MGLTVAVTRDLLDGGFVAEVREVPGCLSQGGTAAEALRNVADALEEVARLGVGDGDGGTEAADERCANRYGDFRCDQRAGHGGTTHGVSGFAVWQADPPAAPRLPLDAGLRHAVGGGSIEELIERSSLGEPDAVAARATVSDEQAAEVVRRSLDTGYVEMEYAPEPPAPSPVGGGQPFDARESIGPACDDLECDHTSCYGPPRGDLTDADKDVFGPPVGDGEGGR